METHHATRKAVRFTRLILGKLLLLALSNPLHAVAETTIQVGTTVTFTTAENAQASCRKGEFDEPCNNFLGETAARASAKEVETSARLGPLNTASGIPLYSTASVYNDFVVPADPTGADTMVDVQITVQYDFFGNFVSGGLYALNNSLSLRVQDRTANALVARHELTNMERQGDQGFTDISLAEERSVLTGEVGHFIVKLRRGHHYRLHFELESSAVSFVAGALRADAFAKWHRLSINVGQDLVEHLDTHDRHIKAALIGVENSLLGALARHDADIKAELAIIKKQLSGIDQDIAEIKTLLLTPQGRRDGFPINPSQKR